MLVCAGVTGVSGAGVTGVSVCTDSINSSVWLAYDDKWLQMSVGSVWGPRISCQCTNLSLDFSFEAMARLTKQ